MPGWTGAVRFDDVSFEYGKLDPVLRDISLDVKPGECVAILGATGSGKSVLMSLIPRFYDVSKGRLLIDGIDVRHLHLDDLRRNIGTVFQESFLFSNTVAANIAFGHPDATQAQIERAARVAAAHDFIMGLPKGYETVLGESGNSLSGGQRQRLAIARAVLLEPAILLLDDPTAAIDSETEHEIFEALDRAIAGRTTFIVAHRLSTLRRADFIIVLENGRIVQRGTHAELIRVPGPYLHVANLQLVDGRELQEALKGGSHERREGRARRASPSSTGCGTRTTTRSSSSRSTGASITRLLAYASPVRRKLSIMVLLTVARSAQLPALAWVTALVITGPVANGDTHGILLGTLGFAALAVLTDVMFHFRQRYALEIGETVVNGLRSDIFAKTQRQPMSFFHRMKLGRILSRVTSDVEAVRVGIQDVGFVSAIQFGQMAFTAMVLALQRLEDVPRRRVHGAGPLGREQPLQDEAQPAHAGLPGELQPRHGDPRRVGERDPRDPGVRPAGHERGALQEPAVGPFEVQCRARADLRRAGADPRAQQPVLRRDAPRRRGLARLPPAR